MSLRLGSDAPELERASRGDRHVSEQREADCSEHRDVAVNWGVVEQTHPRYVRIPAKTCAEQNDDGEGNLAGAELGILVIAIGAHTSVSGRRVRRPKPRHTGVNG